MFTPTLIILAELLLNLNLSVLGEGLCARNHVNYFEFKEWENK